MTIHVDTIGGIVAAVLRAGTATAYAPTDPASGVIVIPDETWLGGSDMVRYVRIDGIGTRGYATGVELHTDSGISGCDPLPGDDAHISGIACRIRDAINAVIEA